MSKQELTLEVLLDRAAISDVVNRYATGIDRRDWVLYRSCFADEAVFDFVSWSGGEPRHLRADDWVLGVQGGLSGFDATQHISSNHVHQIDGDSATCVSYMNALHYIVEDGNRQMQAIGGYYTNDFKRIAGEWRIVACKLTVTWEMGDRALFEIARERWMARSQAQ